VPKKEEKGAKKEEKAGKKDEKSSGKKETEATKHYEIMDRANMTRKFRAKLNKRNKIRVLEPLIAEQFKTGRLYAKITSRPGQCGRADGYILEGEELAFYTRKLASKKKK